jgi:hypothetical protein
MQKTILYPENTISFGKHKGYKLSEIYRFDPFYLEWAIEFVEEFIIDINSFEILPQPTPYIKTYPSNIKSVTLIFRNYDKSDIPHAYNALIEGEILNPIEFHFSEKTKETITLKINDNYNPSKYTTLKNQSWVKVKDVDVKKYER